MVAKRTETITTSSVEYAITGSWSHLEIVNVDGAGYVVVAPEGVTAVATVGSNDDMDVLPAAAGAVLLVSANGKETNKTKAFIASASTIVHIRGVNL
jgi:hypothetical protein